MTVSSEVPNFPRNDLVAAAKTTDLYTYICVSCRFSYLFIGGWIQQQHFILFCLYNVKDIDIDFYSGKKIKRLRLDDFMIMFLNCNYRFYISSTGMLVFFFFFIAIWIIYANISVNTRLRIIFISTHTIVEMRAVYI